MHSGDRSHEAWLLSVQRKLYQWSRNDPEDRHREFWNWLTDVQNLRCAKRKIFRNQGTRTAWVDGMRYCGPPVPNTST